MESSGLRSGHNRPLLTNISNITNAPSRGTKQWITKNVKRQLVEKVTSCKEERYKTASLYIAKFYDQTGTQINVNFFTKMIYKNNLSHHKIAKKPKLTTAHKEIHVSRAKVLLNVIKMYPHLLAFLDTVSIRLYKKESSKC